MKKLSEGEMKKVMGGETAFTEWPVNCTFNPGYTQSQPGNCSGNNKSLCQHEADVWCSATPGCNKCTVGEP